MKSTSRTTAPADPKTAAKGTQPPPKFMELIPPNLGIDFVKLSPKMIVVSTLFILIGLGFLFARGGFNYGIDFAGGTLVQVRFPQAVSISDIRDSLEADSADLRGVSVQDVGNDSREFQIRVQATTDEASSVAADRVKAGLQSKFGEGTYDVLRVEAVGPKVGKQLWRDASLAVIFATLMMGVYIAFRFDFRYGLAAAAALLHDVLVTLGAIAIANVEFDLTTVAALLTIVGFSVNDTVIISDRIRETTKRSRKESFAEIVNTALNETLSRTVINSGTAILVTTALFVLGGNVVHSFAFALLIGFIVGTYSSIFVSTPIVLYLENRRPKRA
jgi:preprotein translocase subunit SecF